MTKEVWLALQTVSASRLLHLCLYTVQWPFPLDPPLRWIAAGLQLSRHRRVELSAPAAASCPCRAPPSSSYTMAPVAEDLPKTGAPNVESAHHAPLPPVGPIYLPRTKAGRNRGGSSSSKPECSETFVRPDLTSRCTWQNGKTCPVQDLSLMTQGPHSLQMPKKHEVGIMPNVLHAIGNTPMVRINRISKELQCDLCK